MEKKTSLNEFTMRELLDEWDRSETFVEFCTKLEKKLEKQNEE